MTILPVGTRVWIARAALPAIGVPNMAGDGTVTSLLPCTVCHEAYMRDGRLVTRNGYQAVAASCTEPVGFVVTLGRCPIAVTPGDPTVLVVPVTDSERSAA